MPTGPVPHRDPPRFATWPAPAAPPSRRVLVAAAAVGTVAAATVSSEHGGLGWTVTALACAAALPLVGWRPQRAIGAVLPRRVAVAESGWVPAALALAAVPAVRDAGWLALICVVAAVAAGSLGVAGRSFRSVAMGAVAVPVAAVRGTAWVGRGLRTARVGVSGGRMVLSALVGVVLLAVFAPLLAGASPAFADVLDALVPRVGTGSTIVGWVVWFLAGASAVVGSAFLVVSRPVPDVGPVRPSRLRGAEWALPLGLLVGLFALYVVTTAGTLFGSDEHVQDTGGLTYAGYARSGFWQLLIVSGLTLVVVVVGARLAPLRTPAERLRVRLLLGALIGLTLVVVASALHRIWLYQQAYGFTVLRLFVLAAEVWLAAGFLLVLVSVLRNRPDRPIRAMAAAGVLTLLVLAAIDPEGVVASENVARYATTGKLDSTYASGLSADAAPALDRLPEPVRSCVLAPIAARVRHALPWWGENLGRARAGFLLDPVPSCPSSVSSAAAQRPPSPRPSGA